MSYATYVEKDGQRIDITDLDQIRQLRCDGCGEYITEGTQISGSVEIAIVGQIGQAIVFHAHPEHTGQALADTQRKAAAAMGL